MNHTYTNLRQYLNFLHCTLNRLLLSQVEIPLGLPDKMGQCALEPHLASAPPRSKLDWARPFISVSFGALQLLF